MKYLEILENRVMYNVFGADGRTVVVNPQNDFVLSAVVSITAYFDNGTVRSGSGFVTEDGEGVVSAAHLFKSEDGSSAREVLITPSRSGTAKPFGTVRSKGVWTFGFAGVNAPNWTDNDLAYVELSTNVLVFTGSIPLADLGSDGAYSGQPVFTAGYPAQFGGEMVKALGTIDYAAGRTLHSRIDVTPGQSGSPLFWISEDGAPHGIGVASGGDNVDNKFVRLTRDMIDEIDWIATNGQLRKQTVTAAIRPDPAAPGKKILEIVGSDYDDTIEIVGAGKKKCKVIRNGSMLLGTFNYKDFSRVVVDARGGSDRVSLAAAVKNQGAMMLGGAGNDTLIGAAQSDVLVGGAGRDCLQGNGGNDILIADEIERTQWQMGNAHNLLLKRKFDTLAFRLAGYRSDASVDVLLGGPGRDACFGASSDQQSQCEFLFPV